MCNFFETVKFNVVAESYIPCLNMDTQLIFNIPYPELFDLSLNVTLQIVKNPKVNKNLVDIDKRFKLLSRQKREVKEENKVEDQKA